MEAIPSLDSQHSSHHVDVSQKVLYKRLYSSTDGPMNSGDQTNKSTENGDNNESSVKDMRMTNESNGFNSNSSINHNIVPSYDYILDICLPQSQFKASILFLAKKLHISGWVDIQDDEAEKIKVTRLSGALTNAVFLVVPPGFTEDDGDKDIDDNKIKGYGHHEHEKGAQCLLLRVYGPNVDTVINRSKELQMLQRLAAHGIGPRLRGMFTNGRFEQFIDSTTLTANDVRMDLMSIYIARRMRELHDGVPLLPLERLKGPVVWLNLNSWIPVMKEIIQKRRAQGSRYFGKEGEELKQGNVILGAQFHIFEALLLKYRNYMNRKYRPEQIREQLVYCHNDAQYGNLLRLKHPNRNIKKLTQAHRELVVIDFEYAGPNMRAFDLANHFCEWMPNYHAEPTYSLDKKQFPSHEKVQQFLEAYVEHGHLIRSSSIGGAWGDMKQLSSSEDSAKSFASRLIDRIPLQEKDPVRFSKVVAEEVDILHQQVLDWRPSSHAMWCAWGVMMSEEEDEQQVDQEMFFDYIQYANERYKLFLGDMYRMGMLNEYLDSGEVQMDDLMVIDDE